MPGFELTPLQWKAVPYGWMDDEERGLKSFTWTHGEGSGNAAALMTYFAMCLYSPARDNPTQGVKHGEVLITYDEIRTITGLSRSLISKAIRILKAKRLIKLSATIGKKFIYQIVDLDIKKGRWVKAPFRYFSKNRKMKNIFTGFSLRCKSSLHAIKIYFLLLKHSNASKSKISFDKIVKNSSINRSDIYKALSLLQFSNLIYVIKLPPNYEREHVSNIYIIRGMNSGANNDLLDPNNHLSELELN